MEEYEKGFRFNIHKELAMFDFIYPRMKGHVERIRIGLEDIRAADSITISYDFGRDGYVIWMDKSRDIGGIMETIKENIEIAFIPAWNEE